MATSSLSKSFIIKTKSKAKNFVRLFTEQDKNPPLRDKLLYKNKLVCIE